MFSTTIAAVILMGFVVFCLLIGYLITGKVKLKKRCGMLPKNDKTKEDGCGVCGRKTRCDEEDDDAP